MQSKMKAVVIMDEEVVPMVYGPTEHAHLRELVAWACPPLTARALQEGGHDLSQVEAIFSGWGLPPLDEALLDRLPACKIVFHAAGTVRTFVTATSWARGVRVTSAADANAVPVAEYTLATILLCLKHAWRRLLDLRELGTYARPDATMPGAFGSTVGLLSLSRIGQKVAERLQAFDVEVCAYDPVADPALADALGVRLCSLDEVFAVSDVVSCHLPLLPETSELLRAAHFARLKPGASFINTARGSVICEAEMIEVLRRREDLFAVLDVVQAEPLPKNSPLLRLPNVIVTPHLAGSLGPECRRMGRMMIDEAQRYLAGKPLRGEVTAGQLAFTA